MALNVDIQIRQNWPCGTKMVKMTIYDMGIKSSFYCISLHRYIHDGFFRISILRNLETIKEGVHF